MSFKDNLPCNWSRRTFLHRGSAVTAMAALTANQSARAAGATDDFEPYPIPWLDVNLHHNQVPVPGGPPVELSHIWNFKGSVGRAFLEGSGKTADGQTLYIGKGTDYSYMQGEYITASGRKQVATLSHI